MPSLATLVRTHNNTNGENNNLVSHSENIEGLKKNAKKVD